MGKVKPGFTRTGWQGKGSTGKRQATCHCAFGDGTRCGTCRSRQLACQPCGFSRRPLPCTGRDQQPLPTGSGLHLGWQGLPSCQPERAGRTPCLPNTPGEASRRNSGKTYMNESRSSQREPCDQVLAQADVAQSTRLTHRIIMGANRDRVLTLGQEFFQALHIS